MKILQSLVCVCVCVCACARIGVVPLHAMKAGRRSIGIAPHILNLGTRWEWSTSCPGCYTPGEIILVPIEKESGWVPELAWMFWEEKNLLLHPGIKTQIFQPITWPLNWLCCNSSFFLATHTHTHAHILIKTMSLQSLYSVCGFSKSLQRLSMNMFLLYLSNSMKDPQHYLCL